QAHDAAVRSCAWSPDGQRIASGSAGQTGASGELKIWVASTGVGLVEQKGRKPEDWRGTVQSGIRACAWSPDNRRLVWAEGETLWICDAASGERQATLQGGTSLILSC